MSILNNRLKYRSIHKGEYESRNRDRYPYRNRGTTKNIPFFWKPYLKIGEQLTPNPIQITAASGRKSDGNLVDIETFNGIIWTLDVTNNVL